MLYISSYLLSENENLNRVTYKKEKILCAFLSLCHLRGAQYEYPVINRIISKQFAEFSQWPATIPICRRLKQIRLAIAIASRINLARVSQQVNYLNANESNDKPVVSVGVVSWQ